ncbi:uncharacterized protein LOC130566140 isoform X2 [Triplophysa rosa]|uniref:Uncharacterized protein n=1 Tax=Triplophysa rosa TaxID=992332 RepID=A0A9W7WHA4_TRIRA|nr:uncharacterized protein LOC130566140 isoform X2 [Triplophysa rosa]KAI7799561.1 hypothetical protein IRJ41_006103 [Triplophysa rosa]
MAPVEEGIVWLSGCTFSLQISIVSALFIIIYVTLHSLCAGCYSAMHLYRHEKKNLPFPQNKAPEVTEQFGRNLNRLEHVSMGTSSPQCVKALPLPSLPSDPTAHIEPLRHTPSFHCQECGNIFSCSDECIPTTQDLTDHTYSLLDTELNEENPYDYISEPPTLRLSDRAEGDSERPSPIIPKLVELNVNHSDTALNNPVNNREMEQPLVLSDRCLTCTEPSALYATVNWDTKNLKNTEAVINTYYAVDEMIDDEAAPPIPYKHF